MNHFVTDLITDHRGRVDEQALLSICGAVVFFALEIYTVVVRGAVFDPFGFGAGIGALMGATSAGFGLRARWTPDGADNANIDPATGRFMGAPQ
ncbi:MAG: hypothetical protein POH28_05500 [Acidocella sp.]|nr:hypothetical protein [Acidocella sp.]